MAKYCLRIITDSCTQAAENALNQFLNFLPAFSQFHMEGLKPYWKIAGQGELNCQFSSSLSPVQIRAIFADTWEGEVADIRWSRMHAPHVVFIWLST